MGHHDNAQELRAGRRPGELLFLTTFLAFSVLLLAQIGWQTTWLPGKGLAAQPRVWPAVGLGGMVLFCGLAWLFARGMARTPGRWQEAGLWLRSLEFAGWYMIYVTAIPFVGYLASTLGFCMFLTWRLGYRRWLLLAAAPAFAICVVLLFKSALNVKIPGGAIYEFAPEGLRYILIRYF